MPPRPSWSRMGLRDGRGTLPVRGRVRDKEGSPRYEPAIKPRLLCRPLAGPHCFGLAFGVVKSSLHHGLPDHASEAILPFSNARAEALEFDGHILPSPTDRLDIERGCSPSLGSLSASLDSGIAGLPRPRPPPVRREEQPERGLHISGFGCSMPPRRRLRGME